MKTYSQQANELLSSMMHDIMPLLMNSPFNQDINYHNCNVEVLKDDYSTVWVKWNKYDCEFKNLPLIAMATITDNIIRRQSVA